MKFSAFFDPLRATQIAPSCGMYLLAAFLAIAVAYAAGAAVKEGLDAFFPDQARQQRTFDRDKLLAEGRHVYDVAQVKAQTQIELERLNVVAEQTRLGLPIADMVSSQRKNTFYVLEDFGSLVFKFILPITAVAFMFLVSHIFRGDHRPEIVVLHTSLLVILLGGATLIYGVTTNTSLGVKWAELLITFNTGSVGLAMIVMATSLSALALWLISRKGEKPRHKQSKQHLVTSKHFG